MLDMPRELLGKPPTTSLRESTGLERNDYIKLFDDTRGGRVLATPDRCKYLIESVGEATAVFVPLDQSLEVSHSAPGMTASDVEHFLEDQVRPRLRSHGGEFVLHAGLVRTGRKTVVLVGPSGRGKSTLCAGLDRLGWPILGDDATVLAMTPTGLRARTANRRLSLLPDSLSQLGWQDPVGSGHDKRRIPLPPLEASDDPAPVASIIVLAAPDDTCKIALRRMSPADGCMALLANSFSLDPTDTDRACVRLRQATEVVEHAAIHELLYPRLYARIPDIQAAIGRLIDQT